MRPNIPAAQVTYVEAKDHCRLFLQSSRKQHHPTELAIAIAYLDFTNTREYEVNGYLVSYPSHKTIGDAIGLSIDQVRRWQQRLIERGMLSVDGGNKGGKDATKVRFNPEYFVDASIAGRWKRKISAYPGPVTPLASMYASPGVATPLASEATTPGVQDASTPLAYKMPPTPGITCTPAEEILRDNPRDLRDAHTRAKAVQGVRPGPGDVGDFEDLSEVEDGMVSSIDTSDETGAPPPSSAAASSLETSYAEIVWHGAFNTQKVRSLDHVLQGHVKKLRKDGHSEAAILAAAKRIADRSLETFKATGLPARLPFADDIAEEIYAHEGEARGKGEPQWLVELNAERKRQEEAKRGRFTSVFEPLKPRGPLDDRERIESQFDTFLKRGERGFFEADELIEGAETWAEKYPFRPTDREFEAWVWERLHPGERFISDDGEDLVA